MPILCSLLQAFAERFFFELLHEACPPPRFAGEFVDDIQTLEGIARVKDARFVGKRRGLRRLFIDKEDAPSIGAVNGGSSYNDGEGQVSPVQFLYAERHLLRRTYQQGGQANGIG